MSLRKCPSCHRKHLHRSGILKQPFKVNVNCGYCGSEFVLKKGLLHYILMLAAWYFVLYYLIEISLGDGEVFFKVLLSSLLIMSTIFATAHLGSLHKSGYRKRSHQRSQEFRELFDSEPEASQET
jgi:hypothetical protein